MGGRAVNEFWQRVRDLADCEPICLWIARERLRCFAGFKDAPRVGHEASRHEEKNR